MTTWFGLAHPPSCQDILRDISQYLDDADRIFSRRERFDQDRRDFYARTMVLFALSNRVIDLAREVAFLNRYASSDENLKNKVYFKRMHDNGLISWEMRQEMISLVNFRNTVSHHFYEITRQDIEKMYTSLPTCREFIMVMEQELTRNRYGKRRDMIIAGTAILILVVLLIWYTS